LLHGPQCDAARLTFALPSECAAQLADGSAGIGLVPVGALIDNPLTIYGDLGIACRGPVRSILLISKTPPERIRTLATDASSRSSALLARIVLDRRYGVEPALAVRPPSMAGMLADSDACLLIGDPALRLDPAALRIAGFHVLDLGAEWTGMTGLPMVFAVWAGQPGLLDSKVFSDSWRFGMDHLDAIVAHEAPRRGLAPELARRYLTEHIVYRLGEPELAGMRLYMNYASEIVQSPVPAAGLS
jgi:predicted solute-binding protein